MKQVYRLHTYAAYTIFMLYIILGNNFPGAHGKSTTEGTGDMAPTWHQYGEPAHGGINPEFAHTYLGETIIGAMYHIKAPLWGIRALQLLLTFLIIRLICGCGPNRFPQSR